MGEKVSVPEELTDDELPGLIESLSAYEPKLDDGASERQIDAFRTQLREMVIEMNSSLARDERIIPELLRQSAYTKSEMDIVIKQISDARGLSGNMVLLPAIMFIAHAWAGNQIDEILSQDEWPSDIQTMLDSYWTPQWIAQSHQVLYALAKEDEEPSIGICLPGCVCPCQPNWFGLEAACAFPGVCCAVGYRKCTSLTCCSDIAWSCGLW